MRCRIYRAGLCRFFPFERIKRQRFNRNDFRIYHRFCPIIVRIRHLQSHEYEHRRTQTGDRHTESARLSRRRGDGLYLPRNIYHGVHRRPFRNSSRLRARRFRIRLPRLRIVGGYKMVVIRFICRRRTRVYRFSRSAFVT